MKSSRPGLALFELLLALGLLLVTTAALVQILGSRAQLQRRVALEEQLTREASNLLERLASVPWTQLNEASAAPLVATANSRLLQGQLEVQMIDVADGGRCIRVWLNVPGATRDQSHRRSLTYWRYAPPVATAEEEDA